MNALSLSVFCQAQSAAPPAVFQACFSDRNAVRPGFLRFSIYSAVSNREMMSAMMNVQSVQGWMMLFCGYVLFLMTVMILQKRSAIVTRDDAQFIFAGPFTRKQTLAYLLIETVEGSLIYALIAVAYILMMMSSTVILTVPVSAFVNPEQSVDVLLCVCLIYLVLFSGIGEAAGEVDKIWISGGAAGVYRSDRHSQRRC